MEAARGYYAIMAPAGTPRPIGQRLNAEMVKIVQNRSSRERNAGIGLDPASTIPEELATALREDLTRFGQVTKQASITAQ